MSFSLLGIDARTLCLELVPLDDRELADWADNWTTIKGCLVGKRVNRRALLARGQTL